MLRCHTVGPGEPAGRRAHHGGSEHAAAWIQHRHRPVLLQGLAAARARAHHVPHGQRGHDLLAGGGQKARDADGPARVRRVSRAQQPAEHGVPPLLRARRLAHPDRAPRRAQPHRLEGAHRTPHQTALRHEQTLGGALVSTHPLAAPGRLAARTRRAGGQGAARSLPGAQGRRARASPPGGAPLAASQEALPRRWFRFGAPRDSLVPRACLGRTGGHREAGLPPLPAHLF